MAVFAGSTFGLCFGRMDKNPTGLYRRPDSRCWWLTYTDASGRPARRSSGIALDDDPHGIDAAALRDKLMRQSAPAPPPVIEPGATFDECVDAFLDYQQTRCRPKTMIRYHASVRQLYPAFTGLPMAGITRQQVKCYIRHRLLTVGPATINAEIALMRGLWRWAVDELELELDPIWDRRTQRVPPPRRRWLTTDECARLIAAASTLNATYLADGITLALNTGMRPDEWMSLTWERVDLDRGIIRFGEIDSKNGKPASIPINATARLALLSRQRIQSERGVVSRYVITTLGGRRVTDIRQSFNRACEIAGIKDAHPHDLRRTFASHLVQAGVSIQTVSGLLRHSNIAITHSTYAHLSPEQFRDATALLDAPPALRVISRE